MKKLLLLFSLLFSAYYGHSQEVILAQRDSFCVNLGETFIGNVTINDESPAGISLPPFLLGQSTCFRLDGEGNLSFLPNAEDCCGEHILRYTYEGCEDPDLCIADIIIIVKCPKPDCSFVDVSSYLSGSDDPTLPPTQGNDCLTTCEGAQSIYYVPYNDDNSYAWSVTGGTASMGVNPAEVIIDWGGPGSGTLTLSITNAEGETTSADICVDILEGPTADFTPSSTTVCLGSSVYFDNNSLDGNSWFWDFGDGQTSTQYEPNHAYTTPGTFEVVLTVTQDNYGPNGEALCCCSDTIAMDITVEALPGPDIFCISTLCSGDTSKYWTDASGCTDYTWTVLDADDVAVPFDGQGNDTICVVWGDGPFGQLMLDVDGCDEDYCSEPTTAIVPIISSVADLVGPVEVCDNEVATYLAPKWPGVAYNWVVTGGTILSGQGTHVIVIQWGSSPATGTIMLDYASEFLSGLPGQDPDDCTGTANLDVSIAPPFTAFGPSLVCLGTSSSYVATAIPSAAYTWTISPAIPFSGQGTNIITVNWNDGTGSYTITATPDDPAAYCVDEVVLTVNVIDTPIPTGIDGPSEICPGGSDTYFAIPSLPGAGLIWTVVGGSPSSFTGDPITVNWDASGPYQLQLQQQSLSDPFCVSEPFLLDLTPKTLAGPLVISGPEGCTNAIQSYAASPAQHPETDFTWTVSPASAGSIISGQGTPNVMVQWNDDAGPANLNLTISLCDQIASESLLVNLTAAPAPTITQIGVLCPGGEATLDAGAGYSGYEWSTGETTQMITIDAGGNYIVTVTDDNDCETIDVYLAVELDGPVASITSPDDTELCINTASSVTINALTGAGYMFAWYCNDVLQALPSSQSFLTHANTFTIEDFEYYVIVTDSDGCSSQSNSVTVSQDICGGGGPGGCDGEDHSFSFTAVNQTPFCNVVDFTVFNSPNVTIGSWNFNDNGDNTNDGTLTNAVHTYQQVGCRFVRLSGTVPNQNPPPSDCPVYATGVVCVPLAADFSYAIDCQTVSFCELTTYLEGEGPSSFAWDFGDGDTDTGAKPSHTYDEEGTYTVTLIATNDNGCQAIWMEDIVVAGLPEPDTYTASPSPACVGEPVSFTATGGGIITWLWDFDNGSTNGSQNPTHTYLSDGSYTVSLDVMDEFGCTNTVTLPLTVFPPVPADTISWSPSLDICPNETLVLTAPAGAGYTYEWTTGATTDTIQPFTSGSYGVTVLDINGCSLVPDPVEVLIYPLPPASISGPDVICDAGCITLDAPLGAGYTYQWYSSGGTLLPGQIGPSLTVCDMGLNSPYQVEVTNTNGCTVLSDPFEVNLAISPTFVVNVAPDPCEGSLSTLSVSPVQPDVVYSWNTGQVATSIDVWQAGLYSVIGRDTLTGCSTLGTATIHPQPDLCLVPVGCYETCNPDTICGPAGLAAYQWNLDGIAISGATAPCLIVTESGTYSLTGTTDFGCSLTTDSLMLTVLNCSDCEGLSAFVTEEEECCWALSYLNDYPGELWGMQVTMNDAVMTVNPESISPVLMVTSSTDHSIGLAPNDGMPLQMGIAEEFMIFCLSEVESFPQELIIDWYDAEFMVACSDTLLLNCPLEPGCLYLQSDSIYCQQESIFYDMTICNPLDADFSLGFIDLQVSGPAGVTPIPPAFDLTGDPIAPGDCRMFSVLLDGAADFPGEDFCFNLIGHDQLPEVDTALCCSLDTLYCIPIPDCNPCDDIGIAFVDEIMTTAGDCCYSIGLFNDYEADFFDGISICSLTPGVELSMDNPFGSDWLTTGFSPTVIDLMASGTIGGHIPLGTISLPDICAESEQAAEQQIEIKWLMGDEVVCRDTVLLNCEPPCGYIADEIIECSTTGGWLYSGSIVNTSDVTMGEAHIVFTAPAGLSGFNTTLALGALAPGDAFPFSIPINAPAMPGDEVCFTVALHELGTDDLHINCCNFSHCLTLPECDTTEPDCLCGPEFEALVDQGINCLPPVGDVYSFMPQGTLTDCETVRWILDNGMISFPFLQVMSNETVSFTITEPGDYRIRMIVRRTASDGSICFRLFVKEFTVADPLAIPSPAAMLFPNPARDNVTLLAETYWPAQTEVRLFDVYGTTRRTFRTGIREATHRTELSLNGLAPGIYWVSIIMGDQRVVEKLIVL